LAAFLTAGKCKDAMMKEPLRRVSIALFIASFLLTMFLRVEAQTKQTTSTKTLALGVVFQGLRQPLEEHFRPLVDYAAGKLSPTGETKGIVVVAPTPGQMMKLLEEKRVDFYMESPYPTYLINRLGAARLLLRRWKGGIGEYRSLIFTNKESGVARLEDLRGKIIAFEDAGSTSGYFLPKLFLFKKGFSVVEKSGVGAKASAREIGYIFAETDKNMVNLVLQNKVAAGAFSNDDYASVSEANKAALSILGESESVPRHLVSVRKDLPEPTIKRLKEVLLSMDQNEEGQKILRQTDATTKFDPLPGGEEAVRRKLVELYRPRGGK
jgi:phosphonate transport system substrate-binding protein